MALKMLLIKRKLVMCMYFSYINTIDNSNKLHDCIYINLVGFIINKLRNFLFYNYKQKRQK